MMKSKRQLLNGPGLSDSSEAALVAKVVANGRQPYLTKIALEGAVDSLRLAAQYGGSVVLGRCKRVTAMHPIVSRLVLVYPAA